MFKGFKNFIMRGNVLDLAVAVVIGAAFTAIVTAFTTGIIKPLINALGGDKAAEGLGVRILSENPATFIDLGSVINAVINFLIVAAVVYFILVVPMERLRDRRNRGKVVEADEPAITDVQLLTEIRDLLKAQQSGHKAD